MALFRKNKPVATGSPVSEFWSWWAGVAGHLSPHQISADIEELGRRVAAIHPDLTWHFSAGSDSQHRLTVSAGGVAALRPAAERWRRAAPAADATWEFRSSHEPDPGALAHVLEIADHQVALADTVFRVDVDDDEFRVQLGVHHPTFPDLPEGVPAQITYMLLDWLLGEDDVERWLGHIEPLLERPEPAASGADLQAAVARLADRRDSDAWMLAQWEEDDGYPGLASFRRGLRWVDHPTFDRHQVLTATYSAQENGMPADAEVLEWLRAAEDELVGLIGGRGVLVGHETCRGCRTFHLYTDGEDQNVDDAIRAFAARHGITRESAVDPSWSRVRHMTG